MTSTGTDAITRFPDDYLVVFAPIAPPDRLPPDPYNRLRTVDDEGRPFLESYAPPDVLATVEMELRQCPYRDSRFRHEKPMNVSALQQVRRHWNAMKDGFVELRSLVQPTPSPAPLSVDELWRLTLLASLMPGYVNLSRPHPQPPPPAWTGAMVKTALGFAKTLTFLRVNAQLALQGDWPADAEEVFRVADEQGALIGPTQVCAGPQRIIVDLLDAIIHADSSEPPLLVESFVGDTDAFQRFAAGMVDASVAFYLFYLARQLVTADLRRVLAGTAALDSVAPLVDELEAVELDSDLFPTLDLLDDLSADDRHALLARIGGLADPSLGIEKMAAEWGHPRDETAVEALVTLAQEAQSPVAGDAATSAALAHLLLVTVRLERQFLRMVGQVEDAVRDSLGLDGYRPDLDHTTIDWLYPGNPRRVIARILGVEVDNTPTTGTVRRGAHRIHA